MAWAKFIENFDWLPRSSVTIAYEKGKTYNITKKCEEAALKVNAIQRMKKDGKHADLIPVEEDTWVSQPDV